MLPPGCGLWAVASPAVPRYVCARQVKGCKHAAMIIMYATYIHTHARAHRRWLLRWLPPIDDSRTVLVGVLTCK